MTHLEVEYKIWKDNAKDSMRKLGLSKDKIVTQGDLWTIIIVPPLECWSWVDTEEMALE